MTTLATERFPSLGVLLKARVLAFIQSEIDAHPSILMRDVQQPDPTLVMLMRLKGNVEEIEIPGVG